MKGFVVPFRYYQELISLGAAYLVPPTPKEYNEIIINFCLNAGKQNIVYLKLNLKSK